MKCKATKRNGEPCSLPASEGSDLCWAHRPENQEARRRGAARGGRSSKAVADLQKMRRQLIEWGYDVAAGKGNSRNIAVSTNAFLAAAKMVETEMRVAEVTQARLVEVELKRLEVEELVPRLEELEERMLTEKQATTGGGGRWGA